MGALFVSYKQMIWLLLEVIKLPCEYYQLLVRVY